MRSIEPDDLSTPARIRHAALDLFGKSGVDAVSVKSIAEAAGVSAPLVIHHFGSKAGLVTAVDDHLVERVGAYFEEFAARSDADEARSVLVEIASEPELITYLGRALATPGDAAAHLFDRMFSISLDFMAQLTDAGVIREVPDADAVAAWLLVADLGLVVMRHHVERVLGVDPYAPAGIERLAATELDLLSNPMFTYPPKDTP